jgi:hypothetical protein
MEVGRRELLAGSASLGLSTMVRPLGPISAGAEYTIQPHHHWHRLFSKGSISIRAKRVRSPSRVVGHALSRSLCVGNIVCRQRARLYRRAGCD